ncbi:MAG: J domain-containing protein [Pseudomonadota bacterium]
MSKLLIEMAYPLRWPTGRSRTPASQRKRALFKHDGRDMTLSAARRRLEHQLDQITRRGQPWRTRDIVVSMNIRFTASGGRDQNISRRDPEDPGVALYFGLDKQPVVLACDRWDTVQDNVAAIAAHIEALRGQERWGVADLAQAFAGHVALPAPEQWWQVLGVAQNASRAEIDASYREKAKRAHPDMGGSDAAMARLNTARDQGLAA